MPNYCYNEVTLLTEGDRLNEILIFVKGTDAEGKQLDFDFNKIVPMPASENENWYEWRWENWGTKWNASDICVDDTIITFETAWNPPCPVIQKLSEIFPDVPIVHYYDEPGCNILGRDYYNSR